MKTKKQAIEDSIKHWKRMIRWAKKRGKTSGVSYWSMSNAIKEGWDDDGCALCKKYADCALCPVCKKFGRCGGAETDNLWKKVATSKTWKRWVKWAEKFLEQLKSLR